MSYYLDIVSLGRRLEPHPLEEGAPVVLGRHPDCDLVVPDRHTSRQQLQFLLTPEGVCRVSDLGSKNPIYCNDQPFTNSDLAPGDKIQVGETSIILRDGVAPADWDASSVRFVPGPSGDPTHRVTLDADVVTGIYQRPAKGDRQRKLDSFYQLAEALAQASDYDTFFGRVLDTLFEAVRSDRGFVALGNPDHGDFQVVRVRNDRGEEGSAIEMSSTILEEIKLEKKAMLVKDAPKDMAIDGGQSILRIDIQSFMCAPIFLDGDFMGAIYLDHVGSSSPFDEEDLRFLQGIARLVGLTLDNLRLYEQLNRECCRLRDIIVQKHQLIASTGPMLEIVTKIPRLGKNDSSILILGETGTGKELVAKAIHGASGRQAGPFVAFNCSLSNSALIESELFGHVKGAFTDASRDHKGKFELAHGGTLFLDEIGDMPLDTQAKILRVLQEREVVPVGGEKAKPVDIRLISATHKDLTALRERNEFRDDLYFRLAVFTLELPALRERGEDILEIARSFLSDDLKLDKSAEKALLAYDWPGNVRELQNVMEQAAFEASDGRIKQRHLPQTVAKEGRKAKIEIPLPSLADVEKYHIRRVMKACGGNKSRASEVLRISRETLYQKLKLYGAG